MSQGVSGGAGGKRWLDSGDMVEAISSTCEPGEHWVSTIRQDPEIGLTPSKSQHSLKFLPSLVPSKSCSQCPRSH